MSPRSKALAALVTLALVENSLQAPSAVNTTAACDTYRVSGVEGGFADRVFIDFSGVSPGDNVNSILSQNGIGISNYQINGSPVAHAFSPSNIIAGNGALNFKVNAYSGSGAVIGAEMATNEHFQFASVRTIQKSSTTPGVVEGNFFYLNDNQEIDWEILTSTISRASDCVPAGIWATNQATTPGQPSTHETVPFTFDPTADFHEYRIDWSAEATTFYIDGQQKARLTTNVPTQAGPWIWNFWSNGDPCWSNGPPTADSITQIRSIEIIKGFTSSVSGNVCDV